MTDRPVMYVQKKKNSPHVRLFNKVNKYFFFYRDIITQYVYVYFSYIKSDHNKSRVYVGVFCHSK